MLDFIKKQSPVRIIAFGFFFVIMLGSLLLMMPFSVRNGVDLKYIDALYTSTSAVCVFRENDILYLCGNKKAISDINGWLKRHR